MDMQEFVNAMGRAASLTRSNYHLTLGALIGALATAPPETVVQYDDGTFPASFCSYRGYYVDLALQPCASPMSAAALLAKARDADGQTFQGYKGGDYTMGPKTPLWCAVYGDCGKAIVGAQMRDGKLILITKEVD